MVAKVFLGYLARERAVLKGLISSVNHHYTSSCSLAHLDCDSLNLIWCVNRHFQQRFHLIPNFQDVLLLLIPLFLTQFKELISVPLLQGLSPTCYTALDEDIITQWLSFTSHNTGIRIILPLYWVYKSMGGIDEKHFYRSKLPCCHWWK